MALDGITVRALCAELNRTILNSRIYKIAQPEADELLLTLKTEQGQQRLLLSVNAGLPFVYLTQQNKVSPAAAPNFCMLLRKHLQNGRIVAIRQPSTERILMFDVDHLDEMGDLRRKTLIVELMGKHSNLIFVDENGKIIDSIKRISAAVSSVREVLPGRDYFIPKADDKEDPKTIGENQLRNILLCKPFPLSKAIYTSLTGFSPVMSEELLYRAGIDSNLSAGGLSDTAWKALYYELCKLMSDDFHPNMVCKDGAPVEFGAHPFSIYAGFQTQQSDSMSQILETYYAQKNAVARIRQKSADLRHIVQTHLERNVKKYDLQLKQLKDASGKEKFRIYGELLNTYGYSAAPGADRLTCENYHTGESITIPLDPMKSALENAQRYFDKYAKLKRTEEAVSKQAEETKKEIAHLESIAAALEITPQEDDLAQIREEMLDSGYIRRKGHEKRKKITSKPLHYLSSDGFDLYVGKNNYQNDELTFHFATGNDWWFHAKGMPGSHVILKTKGEELPDRVFEEAAALAAYYSRGRNMNKVEIDYMQKKQVKKPGGAAPGFVIYYTNYSMIAAPDISALRPV